MNKCISVNSISIEDYIKKFPGSGYMIKHRDFPIYTIKNATIIHHDVSSQNSFKTDFPFIVTKEKTFFINNTFTKAYYTPGNEVQLNLEPPQKMMKQACPIAAHGTFWHLIMELAPRVIHLEKSGYTGKYVLPKKTEALHTWFNVLEFLKIQKDRIVVTQQPVEADLCFFVPGVTHGRYGTPPNDEPMLNYTRQIMLEYAEMKETTNYSRLYLRRSKGRKVVNEASLIKVLAKYGFEIYTMEELSLKEQINLASRANVLVGAHGADMVHSLFMKPNSTVIELFSSRFTQACVHHPCTLLQHNYYMHVDRVPPNLDTSSQQPTNANMKVYLLTFESMLYKALEVQKLYDIITPVNKIVLSTKRVTMARNYDIVCNI